MKTPESGLQGKVSPVAFSVIYPEVWFNSVPHAGVVSMQLKAAATICKKEAFRFLPKTA